MMDDDALLYHVADALWALPHVLGVALGGSRAYGGTTSGSDWDVAIYYRGDFSPEGVRAIGWPGDISEVGGWGPVFNGGGKLVVDGRDIDVHYRDLDLIDRIHAQAERGEYEVGPLLFHQAGLPGYILLAELGLNRTLRGDLPSWPYPDALRRAASARWWADTEMTLFYAREGHARRGNVAQTAGLLSEAACRAAHAVLAARGQWVTNEKRLLGLAGLQGVDDLLVGLRSDPGALMATADAVGAFLTDAASRSGIDV
jgi:predicted nucleotidyltransferase